MYSFSKDEILKFLPHREPFLFVDSIEKITVEKKISEDKNVKDLIGSVVIGKYLTKLDHPIFKGHFPENPILPGVIQVEMMAQVSSFALSLICRDGASSIEAKKHLEVALISIDKAKFRKPILPEMNLTIKSTVLKTRGRLESSFSTYKGEIYVNDVLMSETEFMASIRFV